jgi:hypothetical protein
MAGSALIAKMIVVRARDLLRLARRSGYRRKDLIRITGHLP